MYSRGKVPSRPIEKGQDGRTTIYISPLLTEAELLLRFPYKKPSLSRLFVFLMLISTIIPHLFRFCYTLRGDRRSTVYRFRCRTDLQHLLRRDEVLSSHHQSDALLHRTDPDRLFPVLLGKDTHRCLQTGSHLPVFFISINRYTVNRLC